MTSLVFLLPLLFLVVTGCEKSAPPDKKAQETAKPADIISGINLKETELATIPKDYKAGRISFSPDGRRVAYVAGEKGNQFVAVDDKHGQPYDAVYTDSLAWSRDGSRFAYSGSKSGKWRIVSDGKESAKSYDDTGSIVFSPDGRLIAYEAQNQGKWFVIVWDGDRETFQSEHFDFSFMAPVFSPDSNLIVFVLNDHVKHTQTVFLGNTITGEVKRKKTYKSVQRLVFSDDGWRFVYIAKGQGKQFLVANDFGSDEERTIELPATAERLGLSPDGNKITYVLTKGERFIWVVSQWDTPLKGQDIGPYDGIGPIAFGPDSTTFAYSAVKGDVWRAVVGDNEGPEYYVIGRERPVFSPDGTKIAYSAMKEGKWVMVVSPTENPSSVVEGPAYDMVVSPVFSPDGKYIAYRARTGVMDSAKRFVVIANSVTGKAIKEGGADDEVWPPAWSADGKSAAYGARQDGEIWWRVVAAE